MLENKHLIVVGLVIFLISIFLNLFFYLKKPIFKEVVGDTNTIMVTVVPFFENCNDNFTYSSPPPKLIISALSNEEINIPGKGFKHFYDHFTLEIYGNSYFIKFDKKLTDELYNKLSEMEFPCCLNTVGPKSISKQELIIQYNKTLLKSNNMIHFHNK